MSRNFNGLKRQNKGLIKAIKAERERAERAEERAKLAEKNAALAGLTLEELLSYCEPDDMAIHQEYEPANFGYDELHAPFSNITRKVTFEITDNGKNKYNWAVIERFINVYRMRKQLNPRPPKHANCKSIPVYVNGKRIGDAKDIKLEFGERYL